jgi:hypothetical protein
VQHTSAWDWYEREVAHLQAEIVLLTRLLETIHPLNTVHTAPHEPRREPPATPPGLP